MNEEIVNKLINIYRKQSKHSNYQILPDSLLEITGNLNINIKNTYEKERLKYILKNVEVKGKKILDIGGNTGYFSLEMINNGAALVHYYEGNQLHAEFVELASKLLNVDKKIIISNRYFLFDKLDTKKTLNYDITLLLNVLHHVGEDYGENINSVDKAKKAILSQLNSLSEITNVLIFQLGFNWKGDITKCLFKNGTKREMINFILKGTEGYWNVQKIGIADKIDDRIKYFDLNKDNIERKNELGEFLNRPIFIMKSRRFV